MKTLTNEEKKKAAQIALKGESPLPYLKEIGCKNPSTAWQSVLTWAGKNMPPEKSALLPESFGKKKQPTQKKPDAKPAGLIRIETPEGEVVHKVEVPEQKPDDGLKKPLERIVGPCHIDKFLITAIKHPELGEFYYDKKFEAVDWRTVEGEEISMSPNGWNSLLKELPHILRILGASK